MPDFQLIKKIYCQFVRERGYEVDPIYAFRGYHRQFQKIAEIVKEQELDPTIYILSCFHCMPKEWCLKTWNQSFPPPYALTNAKKALDRYHELLRFIKSRTAEEPDRETIKTRYSVDEEIWLKLGSPTDDETMTALVENGTLSKEFVDQINRTGGTNAP